MADSDLRITASVGSGGRNEYIDTATVQFLLNTARSRMNQTLITLDGKIGNETIGAISDFQRECFGSADGRVDVNGRSFRRLIEIYSQPIHINPKMYQKGKDNKYKVTVGADGRIFVQPNDWLSKYSAAIYGNYYEIYAFGRLVNGEMQFIKNRNLIRSGEVIYHIDTWMGYMRDKNQIRVDKKPTISDQEKKKITEDAVKQEYNLKGDYGIKIADKVGDALGSAGPVAEVLSIILPFLEGLATGIALVAIPFEIYGYTRDFLNASDVHLRMYGLRGAAYATTAWAFDKPAPIKSDAILRHHREQWGGGALPPNQQMALDKAWKDAADGAVRSHEQFASDKLGPNIPRNQKILSWKATLKALGDDTASKLSYELMKQLGEKYLSGSWNSNLRAWEANLNIRYPE